MSPDGSARSDAADAATGPMSPLLQKVLADGPEGGAVRAAANEIYERHIQRGRRGLAICAPSSGAGATLITCALAATLAEARLQILLVEANLWRPSMAEVIKPADPTAPGLCQYLMGEVSDLSPVVAADIIPGLSIIYSGPLAHGARDRFDGDAFSGLLQESMRSYDLTLIDTPPANRCAEARRIAAVAGYAVVVARRDVTMADDMATLIADLRLDRTEVIGSIFNEG